jgi:hypothetical protein
VKIQRLKQSGKQKSTHRNSIDSEDKYLLKGENMDDKEASQIEQKAAVEKTIEQLRIDIRFYERMLDLGHWTIGDQHKFSAEEIAWFHCKIDEIECQIRALYATSTASEPYLTSLTYAVVGDNGV